MHWVFLVHSLCVYTPLYTVLSCLTAIIPIFLQMMAPPLPEHGPAGGLLPPKGSSSFPLSQVLGHRLSWFWGFYLFSFYYCSVLTLQYKAPWGNCCELTLYTVSWKGISPWFLFRSHCSSRGRAGNLLINTGGSVPRFSSLHAKYHWARHWNPSCSLMCSCVCEWAQKKVLVWKGVNEAS